MSDVSAKDVITENVMRLSDVAAGVMGSGTKGSVGPAELARAIEERIVPQLVRARSAGRARSISRDEVNSLSRMLLADDGDAVARFLRGLEAEGHSAETLMLDLLAPAARQLGKLWENDDCSFAEVTLAMIRMHGAIGSLISGFKRTEDATLRRRRILLASAQGEQHVFGLRIVAEFFRAAGWEVDVLVGASSAAVVRAAAGEWYDVFGMSIGTRAHGAEMSALVSRIRRRSKNRAIFVVAGGPIIHADPTIADGLNADGVAVDARDALRIANEARTPVCEVAGL